MKTYRTILIAPALCGALLAGIAVEGATRVGPSVAEPYHARARRAINAIPKEIGLWKAEPLEVPREAVAILHPNAILSLRYVDGDVTNLRFKDRWANLLIDQCRDARDMNGHYPHNCYTNSGEQEISATPRAFTLPGLPTFTLTEYQFRHTTATESTRTAVYNFLIVPDRGIFKDMDAVYRAGEDYQHRFYGAAQFQVVMNADLPQNQRDEIFQTLIGPCVPAIQTLRVSGENP
jgi:hypothetical protein